jgi:hypothetical protein
VEWGGKKKIVVNSKRPVPVITDPVRARAGAAHAFAADEQKLCHAVLMLWHR